MTAPLETIHARTTHDGRLFAVDVLTVRDATGREFEREVVRHPGAVAVVAVTEDPERLLLIRNFRVAVGQTLWEVPAGKLEPGEDPAHAAARELEEETGFRPATVRSLGRFFTSPGFADELMHVFAASELAEVGQKLEPGEHIEVEAIELDEVREMIRRGDIVDGKTIAVLLLWLNDREGRP